MRIPSPATAIALLALFVALTGTGVAEDAVTSAKRLVTGKQLAPSTITGDKIKNSTLTGDDVRDGSLGRRELAPGTIPPPAAPFDGYTKAQADGRFQSAGSYLASSAKATDADKLDGLDSAAFLPSERISADVSVQSGASAVLLTVPGSVTVTGECLTGNPATARIRFDYLTTWDLLFYQQGTGNPTFQRRFADTNLTPTAPSQFTGTPGMTTRVLAKLVRDSFGRIVQLELYGQPIANFSCDFVGYATRLDHAGG